MHRMTIAEAASYMRGQDRRSRQQWEQTRMLAGLVHKVLTGEDYKLEFPWDDESGADSKEMSPEDLQEMWGKARAMEAMMNRRGGNL